MVPRIGDGSADQADEPARRCRNRSGIVDAGGRSLRRKFSLPAVKSALAMSSVEATNPPPTRTVPEGVMAMPFGLTSNTVPFAVICPAIVEGSIRPHD